MTTRPPAIARAAVVRFAPTSAAVPVVRAKAVQTLTEWSVDEQSRDLAALVVSELVTNAVRASQLDDDFIAVRLSIAGSDVLVEVWSQPDATMPQAQRPDTDSETGRGLALVEALTSRWDAYQAKSGGVVVWAQFPAQVQPQGTLEGTSMPRRTPQAVTPPTPAPALPAFRFSTEPEVLARVADRLRALYPWHEPPADQPAARTLTVSASRPDFPERR
jgi:anti-sigma regulatory factor (Ser/Thr protein kinase)